MYLTKTDLVRLPEKCFASVGTLHFAIQHYFSCGISDETAIRIIADFKAGLIK